VGKLDVKAKSPIQVNNHCISCSGNASYIKKAFKLACLTYSSSKVRYQNQDRRRDDLYRERQEIFRETTKLKVEELTEAFHRETERLNMLLEHERLKSKTEVHMSETLR